MIIVELSHIIKKNKLFPRNKTNTQYDTHIRTNATNHAKSWQRPNCIGIQQYLLLCILMHAIVWKPNPQ